MSDIPISAEGMANVFSLVVERDKYRKALEEIAEGYGVHSADQRISAELRQIAREALS